MTKTQKTHLAVLGSALTAAGASAHAAIPDGVKNAVEQAGADLITVGGYILVAIAGLFAVRLIIRILN